MMSGLSERTISNCFQVPAVAALSLQSSTLFEVAVTGVSGGTELKLERKYRYTQTFV